MPLIYELAHWQGRFFFRAYAAWDRRAPKSSALLGLLWAGLYGTLGVGGSIWLGAGPVAHAQWPVAWPTLWQVLAGLGGAGAISTALIARLARTDPGLDWSASQ